jgi:hypothetical protein
MISVETSQRIYIFLKRSTLVTRLYNDFPQPKDDLGLKLVHKPLYLNVY